MSAVAARQLALEPAAHARRKQPPRLFAVARSGSASLDQRINLVFTALAAGAPAECPVCTGRLQPRPMATVASLSARCVDCGSTVE